MSYNYDLPWFSLAHQNKAGSSVRKICREIRASGNFLHNYDVSSELIERLSGEHYYFTCTTP